MDLETLIGAGVPPAELDPLAAALRAAAIYLAGLLVVRLGSKRLLGRSTAFDVIVGVMVGSLLSRAINGGAALGATLVATGVLVVLHWAIGFVSHQSDGFDRLFNGTPTPLIEDGRMHHRRMRRSAVSHRDIEEAARLQAGAHRLDELREVYLERNGRFSIWKRKKPEVLEVAVEPGVQVVRVELA